MVCTYCAVLANAILRIFAQLVALVLSNWLWYLAVVPKLDALSTSRLHVSISLLLAFVETSVVAGVIPAHHHVLQAFVLHCHLVSTRSSLART